MSPFRVGVLSKRTDEDGRPGNLSVEFYAVSKYKIPLYKTKESFVSSYRTSFPLVFFKSQEEPGGEGLRHLLPPVYYVCTRGDDDKHRSRGRRYYLGSYHPNGPPATPVGSRRRFSVLLPSSRHGSSDVGQIGTKSSVSRVHFHLEKGPGCQDPSLNSYFPDTDSWFWVSRGLLVTRPFEGV